jgi:hypothetical protein
MISFFSEKKIDFQLVSYALFKVIQSVLHPKTSYQWILHGANTFQSKLSDLFYKIRFNIILPSTSLLTSHLLQNALTLQVLRTRIIFFYKCCTILSRVGPVAQPV